MEFDLRLPFLILLLIPFMVSASEVSSTLLPFSSPFPSPVFLLPQRELLMVVKKSHEQLASRILPPFSANGQPTELGFHEPPPYWTRLLTASLPRC